MSRLGLLLLIVLLLHAAPAAAQPNAGKTAATDSLVVRVDTSKMPARARQRLGSLGGFRYTGSFSAATLSPDGKMLVVANPNGGAIDLVDVAGGKLVKRVQAQLFASGQGGISLSADGSTLAVQTFQDLRVWDVASGKQLQQVKLRDTTGRGYGPSLSKDGKMVAVGNDRFGPQMMNGQIHACEVATGKLLGPFETLHNYNIRVAMAPDGKTMVSWGQHLSRGGAAAIDRDAPRILQVWDIAAGKEQRQIKLDFGPQGYGAVTNAIYSPDGKKLMVVSGGATFHLIDFATGKETRRFSGRRSNGSLNMLRFSPDGKTFAACDFSGALQAWEVQSGRRIELVDGPRSQLLAIGFPGNGRILALGNVAQSLYWWDAAVAEQDSPFHGHLTPIHAIAFTPDRQSVMTAGSDQTIVWWDAATGKEQRRMRLHDDDEARYGGGGYPSSIAMSPDARFAATVSNAGSGSVRLWNLKSGRVICDFEGPRAYAQTAIAFSPDGARIAANGSQNPFHIWDIRTGQELPKLRFNFQAQNININNARVAFSPDGRIVAVHISHYNQNGQQATDLIVWDTVAAKELHRAQIPMGNISGIGPAGGMAFSPDGQNLALAQSDGTIVLLNAANGREMQRLTSSNRNGSIHLAFSRDGRFLAAGANPLQTVSVGKRDNEPVIDVWELASGQMRDRLEGHAGPITCMTFSPDGATLATGSMDMTALLWDFTGKTAKLPPIAEADLAGVWKSLAASDAKTSLNIRRLVQTPRALAFLKQHLRPTEDKSPDQQTLDMLVADLDNSAFKTRDAATKQLIRLGERAEVALKQALAGNPPLEARRRMQELLDRLVRRNASPEELQAIRGVEILERIGTAEARAWLAELAMGDPISLATKHAKAAAERLAR